MRNLNDWLDGYMQYTENSEPCERFRRWTGIGIIAAALQRKCWYANGPIVWYPNFYLVLIGPSGAKKSTALLQAKPFLNDPDIRIKLAANSLTRARLIIDLREADDTFIDERTNKHVPHTSLTIFNGELTVFLGTQDIQLLTDLTDWYDSPDDWKYGTKHGTINTDILNNLWVNILGATTPEALQSSLPASAIGIGLTARMLFIFAPKRGKKVAIPDLSEEQFEIKAKLSADLQKIAMLSGPFERTLEFLSVYKPWYEHFDDDPIIIDERFEKYYERKAATVCKLACVLNASRTDDMILREEDFFRAIEFLDEAEYWMPYALTGFGKNNLAAVMDKVLVELMRDKRVSIQSLLKKHRRDTTRLEFEQIIEALRGMGACQILNGKDLEFVETFEGDVRKKPN